MEPLLSYTVAEMQMTTLDPLLAHLEYTKNQFGPGTASRVRRLLRQIGRHEFRDPELLIRFHECLLFLRAFPQSASVVSQVEKLLRSFHERVVRIRNLGADMSVFDEFNTSGVAGTTMQDSLNFEAARWLVRSMPQNVEIAWDDYDEERACGSSWPRFIPLLREDADVEANIHWRRWLDTARGSSRDIDWLIRQFEQVEIGAPDEVDRVRGELYDSLRIPLRWRLNDLRFSRTRNWIRPRRFYMHNAPLIARKEVSLAAELSRPPVRLKRPSQKERDWVMRTIKEVMLVRYRELYGTTLGDPQSVVRADLERGIVVYLWNLPPGWRLPLRAYVAGFTLKNGVPINYVEAIGLCEWIEVGFNTFYTFRQGETAWIYAQALRCLRAETGASVFSVYPYQIGQNNDEALDSGAFWFYRKLGFRCGLPEIEQLARTEEKKIAANAGYRTPRRTLKRLAEAHMFYEIDSTAARAGKDDHSGQSESAIVCGAWDRFSTRDLGLRVSRKMAREFGGSLPAVREACATQISRAFGVSNNHWTNAERRSLEEWSLVLSLIPKITDWSPAERREMLEIIRSQSGPDEMRYLHLTKHHMKLRWGLLRLGSQVDDRTEKDRRKSLHVNLLR
jgi:hypothetical protein